MAAGAVRFWGWAFGSGGMGWVGSARVRGGWNLSVPHNNTRLAKCRSCGTARAGFDPPPHNQHPINTPSVQSVFAQLKLIESDSRIVEILNIFENLSLFNNLSPLKDKLAPLYKIILHEPSQREPGPEQ